MKDRSTPTFVATPWGQARFRLPTFVATAWGQTRVRLPAYSGVRLTAGHFRDALAVLAIALGLRLMFALLIADTYDPDEFVVLGLGRLLAHGAVAYRDFSFFHPPGILVLLRALDGVIGLWWPLARLFIILVDCGTVLLIWRIGLGLWGRRGAFAGALLYGVSPVTLVTGVRVEQDPIITFLVMAALTLLLTTGGSRDDASGSRVMASIPGRGSERRAEEGRHSGRPLPGGSLPGGRGRGGSQWVPGLRPTHGSRSLPLPDGPEWSNAPSRRFRWPALDGTGLAAVAAGVCLGAAVWVKYPAIVFLPVCLLAAPRRRHSPGSGSWLPLCGGFVVATGLLFLPFFPVWRAMAEQSINWQLNSRISHDQTWQLEKVLVFWLLINPFALAALAQIRVRKPVWLVAGFLTGGVFFLTSQAYYHYFVPVVAFGALMGAPVAARLVRLPPLPIVAGALAFAAVWGIDINLNGPGRSFVSATRLSGIRPTVQLVRQLSGPHDRILADRLEYAYLSGRPFVPYFWNMSRIIDTAALVRQLPGVAVVVRTRVDEQTLPAGFDRYLWNHFRARETGAATVWSTLLSTHVQGLSQSKASKARLKG